MSYEEFSRRQYAPGGDGLWREAGPWGAPDEVLVIDAKGTAAGILGSANTLFGRSKGTVGFVIDGTCRDSYECTIQRTPVVLHRALAGASDGTDPGASPTVSRSCAPAHRSGPATSSSPMTTG